MVHDLRQLQELGLLVTRPRTSHEDILSSITSTEPSSE